MTLMGSIFLDFNLPNAATWFYFSLLLAVGLFFKFTRILSIRNLDVLALFLLAPGLLLRQEAVCTAPAPATAQEASNVTAADADQAGPQAKRLLWFAYLWLLCGSGFFFVRCLLDLPLVRRPALSPNLNFSGLAWLGCAFFVCLTAVAFRYPTDRPEKVGRVSAAYAEVQKGGEALVPPQATPPDGGGVTKGFWVSQALTMIGHLAVVVALIVIGARHFQDVTAGMAAGTFYLLLPYVAYHVGQWGGQFHHVWPTALLLWAVAAYRLPLVAGLVIGLAAGSAYFPVFLLPAWVSFYRGRGAGRFLGAALVAASVSLAVVGLLLWLDGDLPARLQSALNLSDWQPWKQPTAEGFWTRVAWAWAYRLPVFIAFMTFVLATAFWPMPKNLAHLLALSAAVLIGIQFWYANQGGLYVLWYLPLVLLLVFRPNLADRQPPRIDPENDHLARVGRKLAGLTRSALAAATPRLQVKREVLR